MPSLDEYLGMLKALVGGGIGTAAYDAMSHPETAKGLRPQDDASVAILRNVLRTGEGMGANKNAMLARGITPQAIVQAALRTPGTMPVSVTPQRTGLRRLTSSQDVGLKGTTTPISPATVAIYPEEHKDQADLNNTAIHELIHGMRVNRGLNDPSVKGAPLEETLAYYGSGSPLMPAFSQGVPISREPEVTSLLQSLLSYQK